MEQIKKSLIHFFNPPVNVQTLDGIIIDNYFFGVAAVGDNGHESPVVIPNGVFRN